MPILVANWMKLWIKKNFIRHVLSSTQSSKMIATKLTLDILKTGLVRNSNQQLQFIILSYWTLMRLTPGWTMTKQQKRLKQSSLLKKKKNKKFLFLKKSKKSKKFLFLKKRKLKTPLVISNAHPNKTLTVKTLSFQTRILTPKIVAQMIKV